MAREIEAAGIDFTAHVIGFDVAAEPEARAQMQCIAEGTGGLFLTADNAAELSAALQQVVQAPTPETVTLQAVVTPGNTAPTRPVTWTLLSPEGAVLSDGTQGAAIAVELLPGAYVARATRAEPTGPVGYQASFTVTEGATAPVVIAMPAIVETVPVTFTARVEPDMSVPASPLRWTLFDASGAVLLGPVDAPGGNVQLLPGDYRLSVERLSQGTLHEAAFTVQAMTPQEVIIPLPALLVDVTFSARLDAADGALITDPVLWEVTPLAQGTTLDTANPETVSLPRGAYRVTGYWTTQEVEQSADFVIVDQPREIVLVFEAPLPQASLTAPSSAVAGSTIEVGWTGPDARGDFIGVGVTSAEGSRAWQNFVYTNRGNPARLLIPVTPGAYTISYFTEGGDAVLATVPLTVTPVSATLTAPPTAVAGATVEIGWTGPDYDGDYIDIGPVGAEGSAARANFTYTNRGNPTRLEMPTEPGDYVIRYFLSQDNAPIAEVPISLNAAAATLTAPATAIGGSTIEVGWTGPDYDGDFIGIGPVGAEGSAAWANFTYTNRGNPTRLEMPTEPGAYLIRYFVGQDNMPIAEVSVSITAASASLTAPATAMAGSAVEVGWVGPDYEGDYVGIGRVGAEGSERWQRFTYTNRGNPARLDLPSTPGDYVIRYFVQQDDTILAEVPISLTAAAATLTAPAEASVGSTIEVGWTGPGNDGDYIGIGLADGSDTGWVSFAYTRNGSPASLTLPEAPGAYVLRYFLGVDDSSIAEVPITLK